MKQIVPTLALLSALAGSAAAAPYVLPSPQPGAYTPYDWHPVYALEGLYGISLHDDLPDTYGVRGSMNIYSGGGNSFRHQFSVNVAAMWGSDDTPLGNFLLPSATLLPAGQYADLDLFVLPVTFGYNANIGLSEGASFYLGAKAGYAWSHSKLSGTVSKRDGWREHLSDSDSGGGFTFSVGAGFQFRCSEMLSLNIGYEYGRSELGRHFEDKDFTYAAHTIVLGIGGEF